MIIDLWWILWVGIAIVEALGFLVLVVCAYMPIPIIIKNPWTGLREAIPAGLELEREMFFYEVFLLTALFVFLLGFWFYHRKKRPAVKDLGVFLSIKLILVGLQVFAAFKWVTYAYPFYPLTSLENSQWVKPFFMAAVALSVFVTASWGLINPHIHVFLQKSQEGLRGRLKGVLIAVFFLVIASIIYIPQSSIVANMILKADNAVSWQAFFHQRWSFGDGLNFLMLVNFLYTVALFYFISQWLKSYWLAAAGVLLALKFSMFYPGALPCIWVTPQFSLPARFLDILWLMALLFLFNKSYYRWALLLLGGGLLIAALHTVMLMQGLESLPLYASLRLRQFFPFVFQFIIPFSYVAVLLWLLTEIKKGKGDALRYTLGAIIIYGLVIYLVYVKYPFFYRYGAMMVPWVLMMCFLLSQAAKRMKPSWHRLMGAALCAVILLALLTNRVAVIYPNIWHQGYLKSVGM